MTDSYRVRVTRRLRLTGSDAREALLGGSLVLPVIVVMGALVFFPLVMTAGQSLFRIDPMRPGTPFIGMTNYTRLFNDPEVRAATANTLWLVLLAVVLETLGGVAFALLLQSMGRARKWLLAAIILPWAIPSVVNSLMWSWMFNPTYGVINAILRGLHLISGDFVWSNNRTAALVLIALVHVWKMLPLTAVIMLAALQGIPAQLYEAAKIDGASSWRTFISVTLPLTAGPLAIAMTQSTVTAFNLFDEAWILGGASLDTRSLLIEVYMTAFQNLHMSYGMALSILVMLASLAVSSVFVLRGRGETHSE
ncbi:carbohydrate ABC transporter permease [Faunimonas pinastri]|nr:sugar ABC transporter permease [Faunimonas pinastri]